MRFSLIGLPGSGKSTIGRHLARVWGVDFVDSDHVIEQRLGCSIKEFFSQQGEAAFRDIEELVLLELLQSTSSCVLATGGGVVLREANRNALKNFSKVFYLQAQPDEIARRLRRDVTRPLLQGDNPFEKMRELHRIRAPLYLQTAHYVVDAVRQTTQQLSRKICMQAELAGLLEDGRGCSDAACE